MQEVVLNENGAVNFRFFFSQQRLDSKKENGRATKVKEDEGKCSFQQANNHLTRRIKFANVINAHLMARDILLCRWEMR